MIIYFIIVKSFYILKKSTKPKLNLFRKMIVYNRTHKLNLYNIVHSKILYLNEKIPHIKKAMILIIRNLYEKHVLNVAFYNHISILLFVS